MPGCGARELLYQERCPGDSRGLWLMLGSAGWIALQPAMFTRPGAASGRPAGGRRLFAKRWRPRNMCGESESPGGIPAAKKSRNQELLGTRIKKERRKGNTRQHMHAADPADSVQALRIFYSRGPPSPSPPLPLGQRLPCRGGGERAIPHQRGSFQTKPQNPSLGSPPPFLSHTYRFSSQFTYYLEG